MAVTHGRTLKAAQQKYTSLSFHAWLNIRVVTQNSRGFFRAKARGKGSKAGGVLSTSWGIIHIFGSVAIARGIYQLYEILYNCFGYLSITLGIYQLLEILYFLLGVFIKCLEYLSIVLGTYKLLGVVYNLSFYQLLGVVYNLIIYQLLQVFINCLRYFAMAWSIFQLFEILFNSL